MMLKKISRIFLISIFLLAGLSYSQSAPPSNLKATVDGSTVRLNWDAPSTDQKVTYNIYKAEASSSKEAIDPSKLDFKKLSAVTEPVYEEKTDAASGQVYVYFVVAVTSDGIESAGSNYVNATFGGTGTDKESDTY